MAELYKNAITNLKLFYDSLPRTEIKFMYLHSSDLSNIKIKTEFAEYNTKKLKYYITDGLQKNGYHIYKVSHIRYLLKSFKMTSDKPVILYDIVFEDKLINHNKDIQKEYDINRGDHLTYMIIKNRANQIIVKTHQTNYIDSHEYVFQERIIANECNFTYNKENIKKYITFKDTKCEKIDSSYTGNTISSTYKYNYDIKLIHKLCDVIENNPLSNKKIETKQKGGGRVVYKNIEFMSDIFHTFIQTSFINKFTKTIQCGTIQIIFDEANIHSNDHILFIINDIEDNRYIICIRTVSILKACYAYNNKEISKREQTCLNRYNDHIDAILIKIK